MTLDQLETGTAAVIVEVNSEGAELQRLLSLGFIEDTPVRIIRNAPLLDPIDVEIRGSYIALRRKEAANVEVVLR